MRKTSNDVVEQIQRDLSVRNNAVEDLITISVKDAKIFLMLFDGVKEADEFFHTCQSQQFRQHIQGTYKAAKVEKAFEALREKLRKEEQNDAHAEG